MVMATVIFHALATAFPAVIGQGLIEATRLDLAVRHLLAVMPQAWLKLQAAFPAAQRRD
jgi:hypothetical protein